MLSGWDPYTTYWGCIRDMLLVDLIHVNEVAAAYAGTRLIAKQ